MVPIAFAQPLWWLMRRSVQMLTCLAIAALALPVDGGGHSPANGPTGLLGPATISAATTAGPHHATGQSSVRFGLDTADGAEPDETEARQLVALSTVFHMGDTDGSAGTAIEQPVGTPGGAGPSAYGQRAPPRH